MLTQNEVQELKQLFNASNDRDEYMAISYRLLARLVDEHLAMMDEMVVLRASAKGHAKTVHQIEEILRHAHQ